MKPSKSLGFGNSRRLATRNRKAVQQGLRTRRLGLEPLEDRRLLSVESPAAELFSTSPALFVENQGQWAEAELKYVFAGAGANIAHTSSGIEFQLLQHERVDPPSAAAADETFDGSDEFVTQKTEFSVRFDGANVVEPVGLNRSETVFNYLVGNQASWRTDVPSYEAVGYTGLYDGIDLRTQGERGSLKYEFHVGPGTGYEQIQISYQGVGDLSIDENGGLHVPTALGELVDDAPYIYQVIDGQEIEVAGQFELVDGDTYTFAVTGAYDPTVELVIDPDLAWSTYLGEAGNEQSWRVATDDFGNVLVAGQTTSMSGWIQDGYDLTHGGSMDGFVAKLGPDGSHVWSTFVGGSGYDTCYGIATNHTGDVLVAGRTGSTGWIDGGYDLSYGGGDDGFVLKLDPDGHHRWSTYLGGDVNDRAFAIAVDDWGNALVSGWTESSGWTFGAFDSDFNGATDGFAAMLTPDGQCVWSTYLGGSGNDRSFGIAVDSAGNALVTGRTDSSGWTAGGYDTTFNGVTDAFVVKLASSGLPVWSTYVGGSDYDLTWGIAADADDNVLVTGYTNSAAAGSTEVLITKLTPEGQEAWSRYVGGSGYDRGYGIGADTAGNVFVGGYTSTASGWIQGGHDLDYGGGNDGFLLNLTAGGSDAWSTYLGGSGTDRALGIAIDGAGDALVAGVTGSADWVSGGYDTSHGGGTDAFVVKIVTPRIALAGDSQVDEGVTYTLTLGSVTGLSEDAIIEYVVDWGDGKSDTYTTRGQVTHVYSSGPNTYEIQVDLVDEEGTHAAAGTFSVAVDITGSADLNSGLIAHYTFDGDANDSSGSGFNATAYNNFEYVPGVANQAIRLVGSGHTGLGGGHVLLPAEQLGINYLSEFTLSLWVNHEGNTTWGDEHFISFGQWDHGDVVAINYGTASGDSYNGLAFNIARAYNPDNDPVGVAYPSDFKNHWKHLVLRADHGVLTGFLDGEAVGTGGYSMSPGSMQSVAGLGCHWFDSGGTSSNRFIGSIDDVRIYDRALSEAEVRELAGITGQAPIVVDSLGDGPVNWDDGNMTLRDALALAATGSYPGNDEIHFAASLGLDTAVGELVLTHGQLVVDSDVTIQGPGASQLTVNAADTSRVVFVTSGTTSTVNGLTLTNGVADYRGGGVYNEGVLVLADTIVQNSRTRYWSSAPESWDGGGGIFNEGSLTLQDSIVRGNYSGDEGGGIYNPRTGTGHIEIANSQIVDNSVRFWGGGLYSDHRSLTLADSIISRNSANIGAGLFVPFGSATITNSLISDNSASGSYGNGAGMQVSSDAQIRIVNSTITNNTATGRGGGIDNYPDSTATIEILNSIVSLNSAPTHDNVNGDYAATNSLIGVDPLFVDSSNGDYRLNEGSPALDAGRNDFAVDSDGNPLPWDIRGEGHPRIVGDTVDIGAYEGSFIKPPIVVNTTDDLDDGICDASHTSLREAINQANQEPGTQKIFFNIPGTGPHTIQPTSALPEIIDSVVIDGTTQPGYAGSPIIEIDGTNAGAASNGFTITGGGSTIRALAINRFDGDGIEMSVGGGNWVQACRIGTDVSGTVALGNAGIGIEIRGASQSNVLGTNGDGIGDLSEQNVISGNGRHGIRIADIGTDDNVIAGNFIGVDATGTLPVGNGFIWGGGIAIIYGSHNRVGTDGDGIGDAVESNVISSNHLNAVAILRSDFNVVAGNFLGTDLTGTTALGNAADGVFVSAGANSNTIGYGQTGGSTALANTISFNQRSGVTISSTAGQGNSIRGNSIHTSTGLGIDLGGDALTSNDPGDADLGPNGLQNFPLISQVIPGATTRVTGTFDSLPNATYTLDFYANAALDPTGYGEGQTYLGAALVTTDGLGHVAFDVTLPAMQHAGDLVTATATDASGNTSEFSRGVFASELPDLVIRSGDILPTPIFPGVGEAVTISATVTNQWLADAHDVVVRFYDFDTLIGEQSLPTVAAGLSATASLVTSFATEEYRLITVKVDPLDEITELIETNNDASMVLQVGEPSTTDANMVIEMGTFTACEGNAALIRGQAWYDFDRLPGTYDFPVQGGQVTVSIADPAMGVVLSVFSGAHTDVSGSFRQGIIAPSEAGSYTVTTVINDNTISVELVSTLTVVACPDSPQPVPQPPLPPLPPGPGPAPSPTPTEYSDVFVVSEGIVFSDENPDAGEEVSIYGFIQYIGTEDVKDVPVTIKDQFPVGGQLHEFTIGRTLVDFPASPATSTYAVVELPWIPTANGSHVIQVTAEPSFPQNVGNDSATRAITVGVSQDLVTLSKTVELVVDADGNLQPSPGDTLAYTIAYANVGTSSVTGARIVDDYDERYLETPFAISDGGIAAGGVIHWDLGTIPVESSGTVTYQVALVSSSDFPALFATVTNTAFLESDQHFPLGATVQIHVVGDVTPPLTAVDIVPAANAAGWHNTDVQILLTASDETTGSGVREVFYSIDGGAATTVAGDHAALNLTQEGTHTVEFYAVDMAGNVETTQLVTIKIDKTAPVAAHGGPYLVDEGASIAVDGTASSDLLSGVAATAWCLDGDGLFDDGDPATFHGLDGSSSHPVLLKVADVAGNESIVETSVTVNNVAPTLAMNTAAVVIDEGTSASKAITTSDVPADAVQVIANVGTITDNGDGNWNWSYTGSDDLATTEVMITASDEDGGVTTAAFNLAVRNVAPMLIVETTDVVENSPAGTLAGNAIATDPGTDTLSFSITGGSGAAAFAIDSATGVISVADSTQLDFETTPSFTLEVMVTDDDGATDTANVTIDLLNEASITGTVFIDTNANGLYDANEMGIDGVIVELLDEFGAPVRDARGEVIQAVTDDGGFYLFEDLNPGTYQLHELQPSGVADGQERLGSLGGTIEGNDLMQLALERTDASDYIFSEIGQQVTAGDTATIGFWQNKHGQTLIEQGGAALAGWLTTNFGNIFGDEFVGASGSEVANFYRDQLFRQKSEKSAGPAKVDAQFMAVALATFFTSRNFAGSDLAADYGFNVTDTGIGTRIVNVGTSGAAFGVADYSDLTILQLLWATDSLTDLPDGLSGFAHVYDRDGNGIIDANEALLRAMASQIYSGINEQGDQ